jgi:microcystin-dependent protein
MSTPYVAQLLLASFNYAPKGYALCNGQIMAINQNQALFSLLGTTFGGNGVQTFALPNLQGRTPVGVSNGIVWGQVGGEPSHTLLTSEVPTHTHPLQAAAGANLARLSTSSLIAGGGASIFASPSGAQPMNVATLANSGGSQPHENQQPFLVMNWCIALSGIFPSRN